MSLKTTVVIAAMLFASNSWAINKCTGKDGKVTFQDVPCDDSAAAQEKVRVIRQGTTSAAAVYGVTLLDLSGTPDERFVRIEHAMKTLAELSEDCRSRLRIYGPRPDTVRACEELDVHYKSWWKPTSDALLELLKNKEWLSSNMESVEVVNANMKKTNANLSRISSQLGGKR